MSVVAYKFLRGGAAGPFSGFVWPQPQNGDAGAWVHVSGTLESCRNGVHACRPSDLPLWLSDELWRVELDGEVNVAATHLIASAGRLLERVGKWDVAAAAAFAESCAWRTRELVGQLLREQGQEADAAALAACETLEQLQQAAGAVERGSASDRAAAGMAHDAAAFAQSSASAPEIAAAEAATVGFIAAEASFYASGDPEAAAGERARQAQWLTAALELTDAAP